MPNIDEAIEALLSYQQADMEGVMVLTSRQAIHEVADELKRVRSHAQCGAITPLKWNDVYSHREDGGTDVIGWEADTGFGVYYGIDEYWASDSHGWELCLDYEKLGDFDDPDQAKAFAQKHYAERISSAILTPASCSDLSCAADFLDDIEVDENGKCEWTAVANAQTHIRAALRCWAPNEIAALKHDIERLTETNTQLLSQVEDARDRFLAIQKATVEGRVCDDVAWFDEITTLHDYCGEAADKLSHPSTVRRCQKCGTETSGEEAWVDGAIWCHPCADTVSDAPQMSGPDGGSNGPR